MSFKAINTRYYGPASVRGARIGARAEGVPRLMYDFDHADSLEKRHAKAAKALAEKYGWHGLYIAGGHWTGQGNDYVAMPGITPQMIAGFTLDHHPIGIEGEDWFFVGENGQ